MFIPHAKKKTQSVRWFTIALLTLFIFMIHSGYKDEIILIQPLFILGIGSL